MGKEKFLLPCVTIWHEAHWHPDKAHIKNIMKPNVALVVLSWYLLQKPYKEKVWCYNVCHSKVQHAAILQAENQNEQSNAKPTAGVVSPNPIKRLLGRWPWWSSEGKAQTAGKMQPSERPFAKDARKKGWLEEASTPLGEVKPPKVPEHYQQPPDRPPQTEPHVRDLPNTGDLTWLATL